MPPRGQSPDTCPLHAFLLEPVTALMVQQARDAIDRTADLVKEALACVPDRSQEQVETLAQDLEKPLIGDPKSHGAVVSATDAKSFGLPVEEADPASDRWQAVSRATSGPPN